MILPEHLSQKNMKIIDRYGLPEQLLQLQEECAELIQAVSKYRRAGTSDDKEKRALSEQELRYEIVDVIVVLDQIMGRIDMKPLEMEMLADYKITRQIGRMQK